MFGAVLCLLLASSLASCSNPSNAATGGDATGGGGGGRGGGKGGGRRGAGGGAQPVVTAKVSQRDVPVDIAAVGNVEAYTSISVKSQVTGQLQEAFFHEGDVVKKGDKLFTIDPRPLEAALRQAEANLTRDQSLLNQAQAQLARDAANADYNTQAANRQAALFERGLVSKEVADQAKATADANAATIAADKANVESAKSQVVVQQSVVDGAKVSLSYTIIRSTIDGRTGNNTVKPGNLVTANNTELVTVAQLEPVYVTFTVPATYLAQIKSRMAEDKLLVTAAPQDGNPQQVEGQLTFIDNTVDTATDTIKLKATFPNKRLRLWPGDFVNGRLTVDTRKGGLTVPTAAIRHGPVGDYVWVVRPDMTVEFKPVLVGQASASRVLVERGLNGDEIVVTDGHYRLQNRSLVEISKSDTRISQTDLGRE